MVIRVIFRLRRALVATNASTVKRLRHALDPEATTRRTNVEIKREKKRELEELVKEVGWPRVKTKLRFLFCLLIKHFHQLETENSQLKADLERDHSEAVRLAALLSKLDAQVKLVRG